MTDSPGMSIGSFRKISDIKVDDIDRRGQGVLTLQTGTNQFASQKGNVTSLDFPILAMTEILSLQELSLAHL